METQIRHSVSQPELKSARGLNVLIDSKNFVEFLPPNREMYATGESSEESDKWRHITRSPANPRVLGSPPKLAPIDVVNFSPNVDIHFANTERSPSGETPPSLPHQCLPLHRLNFRPREAKNMPAGEKVSTWLQNVPWVQVGEDWVTNCYPGLVTSSSRSSHVLDWKSCPTDQDIFEQQARQITRIITANYLHNGETTARPITTVLDFSDHRYSDDGYMFDYHAQEA